MIRFTSLFTFCFASLLSCACLGESAAASEGGSGKVLANILRPTADTEDAGQQDIPPVAPVVEQNNAESASGSTHTVQLGTFFSSTEAEEFVVQHGFDELQSLYVYAAQYKGRTRHFVSWGQFQSWHQAFQAWAEFKPAYPDIDVWIRKVKKGSLE